MCPGPGTCANGEGVILGSRGCWTRCNSGQKPEEEVGRLWGRWGVIKVREGRNSMETSDASRGRGRTAAKLWRGKHWGALRAAEGSLQTQGTALLAWYSQVWIWPSGSHASPFHHNVPSLRDGKATWARPSAVRSPHLAQPPFGISFG